MKTETAFRAVILGIGNVLMGDEGVGSEVVRRLEAHPGRPRAEIVDGGTGGFHLLGYFQEHERVLLVDATLDGQPPGTLSVLRPRFSSEYPATLTAHDIGLKDLLDAVHLLEARPEIVLFAVSVGAVDRPALGLSPEVEAAVPEVVEALIRHLREDGNEA